MTETTRDDTRIWYHTTQALRDVRADLLWLLTRADSADAVRTKVSSVLDYVGKAIHEADREQLAVQHEHDAKVGAILNRAHQPYIPVTEEGKRALARLHAERALVDETAPEAQQALAEVAAIAGEPPPAFISGRLSATAKQFEPLVRTSDGEFRPTSDALPPVTP